MIEPQVVLECGRPIGSLPEVIIPGTSEMALFEKGVIVNNNAKRLRKKGDYF